MKNIEKVLLIGSGYTVLILTGFYIFALLAKLPSLSISIDKFFLILLFGMIISVTEELTSRIRLRGFYRHIIRYAVLLAAFALIVLPSVTLNVKDATFLFVALIIFTALYAAASAIVFAVRTGVRSLDKKIDAESGKKSARAADKKKEYKPLYKD